MIEFVKHTSGAIHKKVMGGLNIEALLDFGVWAYDNVSGNEEEKESEERA